MRHNIIIDTDSYKRVHWLMLKPGLTKLYSYGEPRKGGKYPAISYFGARMIIKDHFLQPVTNEMIEEARWRSHSTFGTLKYFNEEVWKRVRDLGYLPIKIMSAPEGSKIDEGNVCFTIESTEPWFATTVNALEDMLMHIWYPTAVATRSMYLKEAIKPYFDKSSDIADVMLPFAVNDFGLRGATGHESAARGGAGHLLHFMGSDNEPAMTALYDYYGCKDRLKSVWATEHSVALSFGTSDSDERQYLIHQLTMSPDDMIISVVIDSKDADNFIQKIVGDPEIVALIKARKGRVVFRPDSGTPRTNIIKNLDILGGIFGYHINSKGYAVLNDNIGLLQGDGMDEHTIPELYKEVTRIKWAADNFITGSGGGLLQAGLTRDTSRWAIKPSYGEFGAKEVNMQKTVKTDPTKASKAGKLKLIPIGNGQFMTVSSVELSSFVNYFDSLEVVLENGEFHEESFTNVLERANKS